MKKIFLILLCLIATAIIAAPPGHYGPYDPGAIRSDGTGPEAQFMKFDPNAEMPAYAEGRFFWDKDNGCPAFYPDMAGPIMQVGQEFWVRVKNAGVATMTNGSVVCLNSPGAGIDPVAVLADASSIDTSKLIGVVTADISPDSSGYATVFGLVRGLNTVGFTPGARVFLAAGSPGTFTETAPAAPSYSVVVGYVMKAHATTGSIYVRPWINGALDRAQFASTLAAATGTAALPTYSFSSDPNTGMYSPAADNLSFATMGILRATILDEPNLRFYSTDNTQARGISFGHTGSPTEEYGSVKMRLNTGDLTYTSGFSGWGGRHIFNASGSEALRIDPTGEVLIATSTDAGDYKLQVNGNVYVSNNVSALSFTDRTPAPENLAESYAIIQSHEVKGKMLDHSKLHPAAWGTKTRVNTTRRMVKRKLNDGVEVTEPEAETISEPDPDGRNLSITITAQALVIKDLIKRIEALEKK